MTCRLCAQKVGSSIVSHLCVIILSTAASALTPAPNQRWLVNLPSVPSTELCLGAEGQKAEAAYAKDKSLPDPDSTDNPEFKIVLSIIKAGLEANPQKWTSMAKDLKGRPQQGQFEIQLSILATDTLLALQALSTP